MKRQKSNFDLMKNGEWVFDNILHVIGQALTKSAWNKVLSRTVDGLLASDYTYLDFPVQWGDDDGRGNPPVKDPLTLYLVISELHNGQGEVKYEFNLRDAVDIKGDLENGTDGLSRLSTALKQLAGEIDKAILEAHE